MSGLLDFIPSPTGGAMQFRTVAERGNSEWRVIICDVVATALRRRSDIAPTSLRQRCDVAPHALAKSLRRRRDVVAACTALHGLQHWKSACVRESPAQHFLSAAAELKNMADMYIVANRPDIGGTVPLF